MSFTLEGIIYCELFTVMLNLKQFFQSSASREEILISYSELQCYYLLIH